MQVLLGVAHEALTVMILAEDFHASGSINDADRDRVNLACARIQRGMSAIGELPEPDEMRRIRRGETMTMESRK
jgi:hypothetical protein